MTADVSASAALAPSPRWRLSDALLQALRTWRWVHSATAILLGALTLFAMGFPFNFVDGPQPIAVSLAYNVLQFGFPMVLAVRMADAAVDAGRPALPAYGLAVLGVALLGTFPISRALWPVLGVADGWSLGNDVWLMLNAMLWHGLGVSVYAGWRRRQRLQLRFIEAERRAAARQRELASARLLALQARVEPAVLFDALQRLQRLQAPGREQPEAADALLQDLITLLRLMRARDGAMASTVARERDLVQAFGCVTDTPALLPPRLAWTLPETAGDEAVAPMWLTELLRAWAAAAHEAGLNGALQVHLTEVAPASWAAEGAAETGALRLSIRVATGDGAAARPWAAARGVAATLDLSGWRERLQAVHGASAQLERGETAPELWWAQWPRGAGSANAGSHVVTATVAGDAT